MDFEIFSIFAVILISITSLLLFIVRDWRLSIALLGAQYTGVYLLVAMSWSPGMAATKLIAGWMTGAVLGMAVLSIPEIKTKLPQAKGPNRAWVQLSHIAGGHLFYLLAASLVVLVVFSQIPQVVQWLPGLERSQAWGGLLLIGMGLLKLSFTIEPLPSILGLLTALSGFEILYAAMETSALVAGLLAGVNLGLALVGAYLIVAPNIEEQE